MRAEGLGHVADQPVTTFEIGAVELLDEVEIAEVATVEHQAVVAPDLGDAVSKDRIRRVCH